MLALLLVEMLGIGLAITAFDGDTDDVEADPDDTSEGGGPVMGAPPPDIIGQEPPMRVEFTGGPGDDFATGGPLGDFLDGGGGGDFLDGADRVLAGSGRDAVLGGAGDDQLRGGDDSDLILGGPGSDAIFGDGGDDVLFAAEILDEAQVDAFLDNQITSDEVQQSLFFDEIAPGPDTVDGGAGDDTIVLGSGDSATGGPGMDAFETGDWIDPAAPATILDYNSEDDAIVYLYEAYDMSGNPAPALSIAFDPDGTARLSADGQLAALIRNAGPGFSTDDVTLLFYTRPDPAMV